MDRKVFSYYCAARRLAAVSASRVVLAVLRCCWQADLSIVFLWLQQKCLSFGERRERIVSNNCLEI